MNKWFEEHPFQAKVLEFAVGTGFSVAGAALSAFITGKMQSKLAVKSQHKEGQLDITEETLSDLAKDHIVITGEELSCIVIKATEMGADHGKDWYKKDEPRKEFSDYLLEKTSINIVFD